MARPGPPARHIVSQLKALQDSIPGYFHFYDANNEGTMIMRTVKPMIATIFAPRCARKLSMRLDSLVHAILNP